MTHKQLRLDFSDYSAKQQERDFQSSLLHTVFLIKVDGEWGHLLIGQSGDDIDFYPDMDLSQTYSALKKEYPNCRPRVIQNKYLEDYLRTKRQEIKKKKSVSRQPIQLEISWNNER